MIKKPYALFVSFLLLICLTSFVSAHTLKGKLEQFGDYGLLPAPHIYVTLANIEGKDLSTKITGSDGIYVFPNVEAGNYKLKIWTKKMYDRPIEKEIAVSDIPVTEIEPILVHQFIFEYPKAGERFSIGTTNVSIKAKGTHYSLPDEAKVWIILKCKNDNFFLATDRNVYIKDNGTWESKEIFMDRPIRSILAVLVTKPGNNEFYSKARKRELEEFPQLPGNSYIISYQNIYFR